MNEVFPDGMPLWGADVGRTLAATIGRAAIPALVLIMLSVTGVAVVLGCLTLIHAGADDAQIVRAYFWVVFWTGISEGVSLAVGVVLVLLLARRIARPLGELASTVDAVTAGSGATNIPDDTGLVEVNRLARAFNHLFTVQERRMREIRELSSHVLHDIKTPIARIRNSAELAFFGKDDVRESSRRIAESCNTVLALVETNAEISRIYAGVDHVSAKDVDVSGLIVDAVDLYSGIAEEKSICLEVSLPGTPLRFQGHPHRFQRLVGNLLDNALKYTEPGGRVGISAMREDGGSLHIVVSDTGIGIPAEAQPHVFERFYRAESSRNAPGFGLGLSLVHAIVVSYGGTIACDSALGRGTTFSIKLPASPPEGFPTTIP